MQDQAHKLRENDYRHLANLLLEWTGIRLHGKVHLMAGRLLPRLKALDLPDYHTYHRMLVEAGPSSDEAQVFINALTTNKTSFFREKHHFDFLVQQVFAPAKKRASAGGPRRLRIYSSACSRGAEPYTIALLAAAHLPASAGWDVKILATDLDTNVLNFAKQGEYDNTALAPIPPDLRRDHVAKTKHGGVFKPHVRSLITFAKVNLVAQPFPVRGAFDAIFCRNVLIYFDRATQDAVVGSLVELLAPNGLLMIGHSETISHERLTRVPSVPGIYAKTRPESTALAVAAGNNLPTWSVPPRKPSRTKSPPPMRRIVVGQWAVSKDSARLATVLGSCVAAALYDPKRKVGGLNHFLLPAGDSEQQEWGRFGVHAMELLINGLLRLGCRKQDLQAKAFGAAAVNKTLGSSVASRNQAFIREFLASEGIPLIANRLGGTMPREVVFWTGTGQVQVRTIEAAQTLRRLETDEQKLLRDLPKKQTEAFDPDSVLF